MNTTMIVLTFLAFVATSLNVVVLVSSRANQDVVKNLYWSHGKQKDCSAIGCFDIYVGVFDILMKTDTQMHDIKWDSDDCTEQYCEDCDLTMKGVIAFAAACCVFGLPVIFMNFLRSSMLGNTWGNRMTSVLFSFVATLCGAVSVAWFYAGCQRHILKDTSDNVDWVYGVAWILMVSVTGLQFVNFVGNLMVRSK